MSSAVERDTVTLARRIAELGDAGRATAAGPSRWSERLMDWAMARPGFKTQLFRFVDVFPALRGDADVARHVGEYFAGEETPRVLDLGIGVAGHVPLGARIESRVARRNITRMAQQFIVGSTADEAVAGLHALWRAGSAFTVDVLGEKTVVAAEADRYAARVAELVTVLGRAAAGWAPDDHLERDDLGPLARVNVSVKPTALATHYEPLSREVGLAGAKERLRPLLRLARDHGAFVNVDMEHYDAKDLTLQLVRDLLSEDEFAAMPAGLVMQAYLRDSRDDLADIIAWSARRPEPVTVRLVKGAYWDAEVVHARAEGWPVPTFEDKRATDANYERCVRLLHDHHGEVRAAFGSHNLRSLAYAVSYARHQGIPDTGYELQMLHGMATPLHAAVRRLGFRLRVYAPVGELVPGMAYLVRRLLENTSNESFVRHRFAEGRDLDELLAPPAVGELPPATRPVRRPPTDPVRPGPYAPEPVAEWRRASARAEMAGAVAGVAGRLRGPGERVPALVAGEQVSTAATITSVDPADPGTVVATSAACTPGDVDRAVAAAVAASGPWRRTPARERAALLFRTAERLRDRQAEIAALECFEAGKPWDQSDADVCEAIDFCEYYAREALRLDGGGTVQSPPGERNELRYRARGVAAVIAPWNFPLAIPTGMVTAALAAGNSVCFKPAEQTPAIAFRLVEALEAAGLPSGVLAFLPGRGEVVGAHLVAHPDVAVIAFTGSRPVGLSILAAASQVGPGQRQLRRVITELGGKNPIVVDADADPDEAVPAIAASAFSFAGQKCSAASRLIIHRDIYEPIVERLVAHTALLELGHPEEPAVTVGPVIDADAHSRLLQVQRTAAARGRVRGWRTDVPDGGWYVGPMIVDGIAPDDPLAVDEHFGPVLLAWSADSIDDAFALANASDYALTAGLFSRSPTVLGRAGDALRAGNIYLNRGITGAVVGRQPFGGFGLSGIGSKAGGPDYLLQFCDPVAVSENTLRQGFAADQLSA